MQTDFTSRMESLGRLVLVLGMHRSGTSALARSLRVLGIALGEDLLPALPCNPKGFFEDLRIYDCNKALLARQGLVWHSTQPMNTAALRRLAQGPLGAEALALLREKMTGHAALGIKDPRMSILLPFWRPVLGRMAGDGVPVHCLISLRHPASVAHSLRQRDNLGEAHSHALWIAHTLGAITGSAGLPRLLVDYELLLREPEIQLQRLGEFLGLPPNPAQLRIFCTDFLDQSLCHHSAAAAGDLVTATPTPDAQETAHMHLARRIYAGLRPACAVGEAGKGAQDLESPELARMLGIWLAEARRLPRPTVFSGPPNASGGSPTGQETDS